jgi:glycosyltransferase involved in cell wall biosynthesis
MVMRWTGMRTYMLNIIRELARLFKNYEALLYYHEHACGDLPHIPNNARWRAIKAPSGWWWTVFQLPPVAARDGVELFHAEYIVPFLCRCPTIVTMHDAISAMFIEPSSIKARIITNALSFISLQRSRAVLVPSQSARNDVARLFKVNPSKIFVTPYGVSPSFKPMQKELSKQLLANLLGITGRFILTVNFFRPRKNAHILVRAFRKLLKEKAPVDWLVMVGASPEHMKQTLLSIAGEAAERIVFTGYVSDELLPIIYSAADVFAFPSRYEGFGLPVIEAMACGTPVVAGDAPAINEFASGGAILVDPNDSDALAHAILTLLTDKGLAENLINMGLRIASEYTWERTARMTMQVYQLALKRTCE